MCKKLLILPLFLLLVFVSCNLPENEMSSVLNLGYDTTLVISGTATDETGTPAAGVWGYVFLSGSSITDDGIRWFETDDSGHYSITNIPSLTGEDGVSSMDIRLLGFCGDPLEGYPNVYEALWYRDLQDKAGSFPYVDGVYQVDFPLKRVDNSISMSFIVESVAGIHPPKSEITVILENHIELNGHSITISSLEIWGGDATHTSYDQQSGLYTINNSFYGGNYDSLRVSWFSSGGTILSTTYSGSIQLNSGNNDMGTFVVQ